MKLCCKILGTATIAIFPSMGKENFLYGSSVFKARSRLNSVSPESTQAMPCAIKVAQATPPTPIRNAATNKISRPMLPIEEPIRKYSGVLESPNA